MTSLSGDKTKFAKDNWPGLILGLFTLVSVGLIILAQIATSEAIASRRAEDTQANLAQVIPGHYHDNNLLDNPVSILISGKDMTVYQGKIAGQLSAVAFTVTATDGYAGPMTILLGIDLEGTILGVRVLNHTETPGLGDKIEILKSDWITSFEGKSLNNLGQSQWAVKKDGGQFDAFSGATITPRAVVKAVYKGLKKFNEHQLKIFTPQDAKQEETGQ